MSTAVGDGPKPNRGMLRQRRVHTTGAALAVDNAASEQLTVPLKMAANTPVVYVKVKCQFTAEIVLV